MHCWRHPLPQSVTLASSDAERSFDGRVHGPATIPARLINARGISTTVAPTPGDVRPLLEKSADLATVLGAAVAFFGLLGVVVSLWLGRRQAQSERTERILDRYDTTEFARRWIRVQGLLTAKDAAAAVEQIRRYEVADGNSDPIEPYGVPAAPAGAAERTVSRFEVLDAANFYQQVAVLANRGQLDKRLLVESFGPILLQALEAGWWWIQFVRTGNRAAARTPVVLDGETATYAEWERAARWLARADHQFDKQRFNDAGRDDRVRAICLPRERKCGDSSEWDAYGRLSKAVAELLDTPGGETTAPRRAPER